MLVHHAGAGLETALLGSVLVLRYRETPTLETVDRIEHHVSRAVAARERIAILVIIEEQPVPDAPTRRGIAQLLQRHAQHAIAIAQVVRGEGFMAATVRAVLASIAMVVRPPYPMRVFAAHEDAVRWLERQGARMTPSERACLD